MQRTLHLLDAENLALTSNCTVEAVHDSFLRYTEQFEDLSKDLRIIACSHHNAAAVFFGWSALPSQSLMRSGKDGADLALIEECLIQVDTLNVNHVVIGSGDGLFLGLVQDLQARGIFVTVVAVEGRISNRLRLAANHVIILADPNQVAGQESATKPEISNSSIRLTV